jgi:hypothetical protein
VNNVRRHLFRKILGRVAVVADLSVFKELREEFCVIKL